MLNFTLFPHSLLGLTTASPPGKWQCSGDRPAVLMSSLLSHPAGFRRASLRPPSPQRFHELLLTSLAFPLVGPNFINTNMVFSSAFFQVGFMIGKGSITLVWWAHSLIIRMLCQARAWCSSIMPCSRQLGDRVCQPDVVGFWDPCSALWGRMEADTASLFFLSSLLFCFIY